MSPHKRALLYTGMTIMSVLLLSLSITHAQTSTSSGTPPITFSPEIPIPGLFSGESTITGTSIATYIRAIFIFFIWTVGALATVMVIYGGIKWVAAAGNPGRINDARDVINSAIIGVVIALTSVVLLNIISPSLTNLRGLDIATIHKELANFYKAVDSSITRCPATQLKGSPDMICGDQGCSTQGTLNEWATTAVSQSGGFTGRATDPFIVKAIIAQESLRGDSPYSRDTQVTKADGSPASTAYGIGQFVAATLYDQLKAVRINGGGLPTECPENAKVVNGRLNPTCKLWLDQTTSPSNQLVGFKAQVFMVENYLNQVSNAQCVSGNLGRMAAAYYLGAGGVKEYCRADDLVDTTATTTAEVSKRIDEARQYVESVSKYYSQYCSASS